MSQATVVLPTSGIVSGVTMAQNINSALDAIRTAYSGASAPSADAPEEGQCWLDTGTSTSWKFLKRFDGNSWLIEAAIDDVNHIYLPPVGGGQLTVSSTAPTIGGTGEPAAAVAISGTTAITTFGSSALTGQIFFVTFQGVLTLTYNAVSFILPGRANITTAAGDMSIWQYLGSGNWQCLVYQPVGTLVGSVGTVTGAFVTNNAISPTQITSNQNDYAPSGIANAAIVELTTDGLSDYLITGISASQTGGRYLTIRNANAAGGGRIYFPNQSTSSASANRFKQAGVVQLNPQQQVTFVYDNSASAWVPHNVIVAQPPAGSTFKNLIVGNAAGINFTAPANPPTQMKVTADLLVLNDVDGNSVTLANVSVTPASSVTGANGLDSTAGVGLSTSQWYATWVIFNPITNTAAGLFSTSYTAPTMPSGYTFKARVASAFTGSSKSFYSMNQQGRDASWVPGSTLMAVCPRAASTTQLTSTTSSVTIGIGGFAPPASASAIDFNLEAAGNNGVAALGVGPSSTVTYTTVGSMFDGTHPDLPLQIQSQGANVAALLKGRIMLLSTSVVFQTSAVASGPSYNAFALGYQENL